MYGITIGYSCCAPWPHGTGPVALVTALHMAFQSIQTVRNIKRFALHRRPRDDRRLYYIRPSANKSLMGAVQPQGTIEPRTPPT